MRIIGQEEEANIKRLQGERIRLRRLVKLFKDNDEEYLKIKKTVEGEISSALLDGKGLLKLAFDSLMISVRKDPKRRSALIHYANNMASYSDAYYTSYFGNRNGEYPHQLNSYDSFLKALESTILEDANKLYEQLLKEQVNTIIADYASNRNLSLSSTTPTNNRLTINKGS